MKEVADLQGNTMESPVTMNLYVYRNPLRWDVKRIERDVDYGNGLTFEATVKNLSDHEADASLPTLSFRFFDASEGKVYSVKPADGKVYAFANDAIIGTDVNPVILQNSYDHVQAIKLKKGWNWVSFNVIPKEGTTMGQFLNSMSKWDANDMIIAVNGTKSVTYKCYNSKKTATSTTWRTRCLVRRNSLRPSTSRLLTRCHTTANGIAWAVC